KCRSTRNATRGALWATENSSFVFSAFFAFFRKLKKIRRIFSGSQKNPRKVPTCSKLRVEFYEIFTFHFQAVSKNTNSGTHYEATIFVVIIPENYFLGFHNF